MRRSPGPALVLLVAAAVAGPCIGEAAAQPSPSGDQRALATALFKEGRALMAAGDYAAACSKLTESQRLDPGGGTLLNLAICHAEEGKTASAWSELHEALGQARRDGRVDRARLAEARIAEIEPKLCRLRIEVAPELAALGVQIEVNGARRAPAAWHVAAPVNPGPQRIVVSAPGHERWEGVVEITEEGETVVFETPELTRLPAAPSPRPTPLAPEPPPAPSQPPPRDPGWEVGRAVGWGFAGLGLVATGIGIGAGVVALEKRAAADEACIPRCRSDALALHSDGRTAADVSTFWFATAGVSLATAAVFLVTGWGDPVAEADRASLGALRF